MSPEHDAGGGFPRTRHSIVIATRSDDEGVRRQAMGILVESYWRPVYKYLRIKWRLASEDARDATQGFFAAVVEKGFFESYDPARAKFRTFLRVCLDRFVSNERKAARRLKRGGDQRALSLDFESAEGELLRNEIPGDVDVEDYFHQEWVRALLAQAIETLRQRCQRSGRELRFALFERYDVEGPDADVKPTYASLAAELGVAVTHVTNELHAARGLFREIVLDRLREITASEQEFREEARELLGFDPP